MSWLEPVQAGHAPGGSAASVSSTMARMSAALNGALMKLKLKASPSSSAPAP